MEVCSGKSYGYIIPNGQHTELFLRKIEEWNWKIEDWVMIQLNGGLWEFGVSPP